MPSAVACPVCGADGTGAANAYIAQCIAAAPAATAPRREPLQVALAERPESAAAPAAPAQTTTRYRPTLMPGQIDRTQAQHEARAKISWGDSPKEVIGFLMMQGYTAQEASALVEEIFKERVAAIRVNGIKKIVFGSLLVCLPIAFYLICLGVGMIPMKLFAVTIMAGLYGAYQAIKGVIMLVAPKSEPGDVATQ
jgi:hypothetical protein